MSNIIFAYGETIFSALKNGAQQGYNRSTDDYNLYINDLNQHYEAMIADLETKKQRQRVRRFTQNNWRNAFLPIGLALVHEHKAFEPCEPHARVFLPTKMFRVYDITMHDWNEMKRESQIKLA